MKIACCQINPVIGDLSYNSELIYNKLIENREYDLVLFPELALTGYSPRDLLLKNEFIIEINKTIKKLCAVSLSENLPPFLLGTITGKDSENIFNSVILIENGKISYEQHKKLLPDYDVHDESRYYHREKNNRLLEFKAKKIGILICEDAWFDTVNKYVKNPVDYFVENKPDLIINMAASPYYYGKPVLRKKVFGEIVSKVKSPFLYLNMTGGNDDIIFDGGSFVLDNTGEIVIKADSFREYTMIYDTEKKYFKVNFIEKKYETIFQGLCLGLSDYFKKCRLPQKVVIGISGGIDSAVVAYLACKVFGKENVLGLALPTQFSSQHSLEDAEKLCENLGMKLEIVDIRNIFELYNKTLSPHFESTKWDVTEQNIQARIRGNILMSFSNKFGYQLLTTGNKSEIAVGYCTLYGDMCGAINPIGDLYKTEIYEFANYINSKEEIIPENIIKKAPSAELAPNQKDQDSLPPYDILDGILYSFIEENLDIKEIIKKGYDEQTVNWTVNQLLKTEYKRKQAAIILKVSKRAFGQGWRMPVAKKYII
ncbi:MAG: NAD+ synthase [Candidatus Muiribacteriota bacterium]